MRRREFLAASCLAGLAPWNKLARAMSPAGGAKKQLLELRLYSVASEAKRKLLDELLAKAAIPAWNRIGIRPVGAFGLMKGDSQDLYVLLPHASCESALTATRRLLGDEQFVKDGAAALDAPKSDPLYQRVESKLMVAFDAAPKVERPSKAAGRVFQLRIYESHSIKKAAKKVEMFNAGGEIAIFRRSGMDPVFFGETIIGPGMPNLTYMLGFDDMDANKAGWAKFLADPAWGKLRRDPQYKDTVSRIHNILLVPTAYSQI